VVVARLQQRRRRDHAIDSLYAANMIDGVWNAENSKNKDLVGALAALYKILHASHDRIIISDSSIGIVLFTETENGS
jgi:hypothetical protein